MDKKLKRNILKGSAATSIGTISGMVFQFITIMIMTRYVSKDDLGIYFLVIVIVNMFNLLGGLGVELTMVKFIASDSEKESRDVLIPILLIRAVGCIFFSVIFVFAGRYLLHLFDDRIYQFIWYILAIFLLANFRDLFYNLMQALKQFKQYSIVNVVSSAFRVIIVFAFILFGKLDLWFLLIIEILATAQPLVHQLLVIPFRNYLATPTSETFKKIIRFSIPLYLNNLVVFINGRMHIFIIGAYLSPASIANFSVANKVPVALKKIFSSFIIVYFPNLAKLFADGDKKTAVKLIEKSMAIFSITISLFVILSFLFRIEIVQLLFSAKYSEVSIAFALLILNFFIRGLADLMGYPFVPAGYPSIPARINTFASIISIGLSFIFVPIYGFIGAVFALLVMNTFSLSLFFYYASKFNINPKIRYFLKPALLFFIAPVSFLLTGELSKFYNIILFALVIVVSWFLSNDLRRGAKFVIERVRNLKPAKDAIL